ncbi:MAG: hypothetical protein LBI65_02090, partial [Candidatus Symbiothrix sp.]|nr:hypothetical protein [Candidatus Symbiothrix sp.]
LFLNDRFVVLGKGRHAPNVTGAPDVFGTNDPDGLMAVILSFSQEGLQKEEETKIHLPETPDRLTVTASADAITVRGNGAFRVINLSGATVYSGFADGVREVPLKKGIYIVTGGEKAIKVAVR